MGVRAEPGKVKLTQRQVELLDPSEGIIDIRDAEIQQMVLRVYPISRKFPNGQKSYFLRYRNPKTFKQTWYKLGEAASMSVALARDEARKKLAEVIQGTDPVEAKRARRADAITLGEFIDGDYAKTVLAHLKSGQAIHDRLKRCFESFWKRKLNDATLHNAIQHWRAKRLKDGVSRATVNRDLGALKAVFARALDRDLIKEHPLRKVKPLKLDKNGKVRYLSPDEEKRLMKALDAREERIREERDSHIKWCNDRDSEAPPTLRDSAFADYLKPMVLLSLNTGLRRGELFNLEWRDIDFDQSPAILTVRGDVAKSGSTRYVPLSARALEALQGWKAQTDGSGLVFKSANGSKFDNCNTSWEAVLESAKITDFRWHDMRHHFASTFMMRGGNLNTLWVLLGHADIKMTLRYAHLSPDTVARAISIMNSPAVENVVPFAAGARQA
jgi:integrase